MKAKSLRVVAWEATKACRFKCIHCRAEAQINPDPNQLSTEEALEMVEEITSFSKPLLIVTGGDPLLREDVFKIVEYASLKGLDVAMALSGSKLTSSVVGRMKKAGVRTVSISIDGHNAEVHDRFRGVTGAFDEALKATRAVKDCGLDLQINTTISKYNVNFLDEIRSLVLSLGASSWDLFMLIPTGKGRIEMEVEPKEYEKVMSFIYELSRILSMNVKMTCTPHYVRFVIEKESGEGNLRIKDFVEAARMRGARGCMAGNGYCFISHIGEVYGCGFLPISAGSIREKPLKEIYEGSMLFEKLRDRSFLKGKCGLCRFKAVCGGCRARAYGVFGDLFQQEPYCFY
ncbi:MAG: radical SAM protein [archaeon]|nr:radical SAM protein [archaeon]